MEKLGTMTLGEDFVKKNGALRRIKQCALSSLPLSKANVTSKSWQTWQLPSNSQSCSVIMDCFSLKTKGKHRPGIPNWTLHRLRTVWWEKGSCEVIKLKLRRMKMWRVCWKRICNQPFWFCHSWNSQMTFLISSSKLNEKATCLNCLQFSYKQ